LALILNLIIIDISKCLYIFNINNKYGENPKCPKCNADKTIPIDYNIYLYYMDCQG